MLELSGRAGRNNEQSLCVLYFNSKQKLKDPELKTYCSIENKENCRRNCLLKALGETTVRASDPLKCCDHCNPNGVPVPRLQSILKRGKKKYKPRSKRACAQQLDEVINELNKRLTEERDKIISQNRSLVILGSHILCNDKVISNICHKSYLLKKADDLSSISGLRPQFFKPFYDVIQSSLDSIPQSAKL